MSSSPATDPSAELIRCTNGSARTGRTCTPCVTPMFPTTRGSAHRPRTAGTGWLACTKGNSSASPEEVSATGRPASDPLAKHTPGDVGVVQQEPLNVPGPVGLNLGVDNVGR